MTKTPTWPRAAALVAALAIAITATACSSGGKVNTTAPTSLKPSDPPTTVDAGTVQKAAVLDGYKQYVDVYIRSLAASNPDDPGLPEHLTGAALLHQRLDLGGLRSAGEVLKVSDVVSRPAVVSIDPTKAVVDDCLSGVPHYYDIATGAVRGTVPAAPSSDAAEYVLVLEGRSWKVSEKNRKDAVCHS